mmetsp:Transcript_55454/g.104155  ORF Transcript_55454/g.104155 Transcript_55454/m.104155 type:complete len:445 (-) Transcript_55454:92-1426(-)
MDCRCLAGLRAGVGNIFNSWRRAHLTAASNECEQDGKEKARRKEMWANAKQVAQSALRKWMKEHPGHSVPDDVFSSCEEAVRVLFPAARVDSREQEVSSFVRHSLLELLRTEGPPQRPRSMSEWQALFPRYPSVEEGYLMSFEPSESSSIRSALDTYGFCVVKVLSAAECEASVIAMFEEINLLRLRKGIDGPPVDVEKSDTWFDKNWPASCKFLVDDVALHKQAFANRCSKRVYQAFSGIWGEHRLHVSVDKWGLARGAKDKPRWRVGLKPHWDVNPWQCVRDLDSGMDPGYQGVIALRDQDLETGCHLTLPGCARFIRQWCKERKLESVSTSLKSFRAAEDDPILSYMQPVPLRQGEMVIWSCAQLHGSTHNRSDKMRLAQYVRMFPAREAGVANVDFDTRDGFSCTRVLSRCLKKGELTQKDVDEFEDPLSRRLLGLDVWN